ncbi:unnamed protein product [Amoebophrya sp. A120]|nr:unnamed protein product [Amoebophrya sp. A120]|eukprot:GSA120T00017293001.1
MTAVAPEKPGSGSGSFHHPSSGASTANRADYAPVSQICSFGRQEFEDAQFAAQTKEKLKILNKVMEREGDYDIIFLILIMVNLLIIGIETDVQHDRKQSIGNENFQDAITDNPFFWIECFFLFAFTVELILRYRNWKRKSNLAAEEEEEPFEAEQVEMEQDKVVNIAALEDWDQKINPQVGQEHLADGASSMPNTTTQQKSENQNEHQKPPPSPGVVLVGDNANPAVRLNMEAGTTPGALVVSPPAAVEIMHQTPKTPNLLAGNHTSTTSIHHHQSASKQAPLFNKLSNKESHISKITSSSISGLPPSSFQPSNHSAMKTTSASNYQNAASSTKLGSRSCSRPNVFVTENDLTLGANFGNVLKLSNKSFLPGGGAGGGPHSASKTAKKQLMSRAGTEKFELTSRAKTNSFDLYDDDFTGGERRDADVFSSSGGGKTCAGRCVHRTKHCVRIAIDNAWTVFDTFIVLCSFVDLLVLLTTCSSSTSCRDDLSSIAIFRLLRIMRVFRTVKLLRYCKSLWLLCHGLVAAFRTIMWIAALLCFLIYASAIFLTRLIGHDEDFCNAEPKIEWYYGTVLQSMYSLFIVLTLEQWPERAEPVIRAVGPGMAFFFIFYIIVTNFTVLNLVVGVICENIQSLASTSDLDLMRQVQQDRRLMQEKLLEIFCELDIDKNGELSKEELTQSLNDSQIRAILSKNEIQDEELHWLFEVLDRDGSETLTIEEFVNGVMALKSSEQARDLVSMQYTLVKEFNTLSKSHEQKVEALDKEVQDLKQELWRHMDKSVTRAIKEVLSESNVKTKAGRKKRSTRTSKTKSANGCTNKPPAGEDGKNPAGAVQKPKKTKRPNSSSRQRTIEAANAQVDKGENRPGITSETAGGGVGGHQLVPGVEDVPAITVTGTPRRDPPPAVDVSSRGRTVEANSSSCERNKNAKSPRPPKPKG